MIKPIKRTPLTLGDLMAVLVTAPASHADDTENDDCGFTDDFIPTCWFRNETR